MQAGQLPTPSLLPYLAAQVASQPALAPPAGGSTGLQQLGQAAVASAPGVGVAAAGDGSGGRVLPDRPSMRQRTSGGGGPKAD